jgi:hypothetical protein
MGNKVGPFLFTEGVGDVVFRKEPLLHLHRGPGIGEACQSIL